MRVCAGQLSEGVMKEMQKTLWNEYGVNVNTSAWNRKVTDDWDKAQSLVRELDPMIDRLTSRVG